MGKIKTHKVSLTKSPFEQQIVGEDIKLKTRTKVRGRTKDNEEYVDEKLSKKILDQARKQQEELEDECADFPSHSDRRRKTVKQTSLGSANDKESDESEGFSDYEDNYYEHTEINEEDEKALQKFMSQEPAVRRTLADLFKEKLTEKETEMQTMFSDCGHMDVAELDERVVKMYKEVKHVLSHYRSGKLPKAFKIIPSLSNWEQILHMTDPDNWTAATVYQATRIFASNLKEKMAQRFFNLVLFPRIRDDIAEYKKLNFHLYQALRKALFKPGAFFKGIVLPLCESGTCTLREAIIIGSVITKNSVPLEHSAAAILKIAEMDYTGANSIFLRVLLDKKYALPLIVVNAVVYHFLKFRTDKRELPVLWHQCFLTFAQRYKNEISREQKDLLLELLKVHSHHQITSEIRWEYQNSKCCDDITEEPMSATIQEQVIL